VLPCPDHLVELVYPEVALYQVAADPVYLAYRAEIELSVAAYGQLQNRIQNRIEILTYRNTVNYQSLLNYQDWSTL